MNKPSSKLVTAPASTALKLPATQPKPRQVDIINAMVERARVKHAEEFARLQRLRKDAEEKLNTAVIEELRKNPKNFEINVRNYARPEVEYVMIVIPPAITKLKDAVKSVPQIGSFDAAAVKHKIREGMNTSTDRVKALLSNPEAVEKLDAALSAIA